MSSMVLPRRPPPSCFSPSRGTPDDPAREARRGQLEAQYTGEFFEQRYATLKRELFAKIDNELAPVIKALRRELAAANNELARLRAAQPAH